MKGNLPLVPHDNHPAYLSISQDMGEGAGWCGTDYTLSARLQKKQLNFDAKYAELLDRLN